jgi:hypothetical protein
MTRMSNLLVGSRQIHLDFHTSEHIDGVGADFDPDEFVRVLKQSHVDSVTCFSRCHHGMIYHDTKFPARHPHLTRNLLAEQIEACHKAGIRVPIYSSVGLDEYSARNHPEWREVNPQGRSPWTNPFAGAWYKLCINQEQYVQYLIAQTEEILETLPTDGLFYDIVMQLDCCCESCLAGMIRDSLNPEDSADRAEYGRRVVHRFCSRMTDSIRRLNPACTVFYNSGHISPQMRGQLTPYSHLEMESLPSGGYGYDHFPWTVRYARRLGLDYVAMTGKFLKSWADFGGFKTEAGLEYDCFTGLAYGAKLSVGDQLHPSGKISKMTYDLIGHVYSQAEALEPWCCDVTPQVDIAVISPEAYVQTAERVHPSAAGALRILQEGHHQFDVVDENDTLENYRVVILPDVIPVSIELRVRLETFVANGGAVLCSFESAAGRFAVEGASAYSPDYVVPNASLGAPVTEYVMYDRAKVVNAPEGSEILGHTKNPYFNRTWQHFCSHFQTPNGFEDGAPSILRDGRTIYFAHPIFAMYCKYAARAYKQMVLGGLAILLNEPLIKTDAPSTARITANRQETKNRTIVHVLHYIPERRAESYDVVEDVIPLHHVSISLRADYPVSSVYLEPSHTPLHFLIDGSYTKAEIPKVSGHSILIFE